MSYLARRRQLELSAQLLLEALVPAGIQALQVVEVPGEREAVGKFLALGNVTDAFEVLRRELLRGRAQHADVAVIGTQDVHQHADGGGLARAVRPDQREYRSFGHAQAEVFDGFEAPKAFPDAMRLDDHGTTRWPGPSGPEAPAR